MCILNLINHLKWNIQYHVKRAEELYTPGLMFPLVIIRYIIIKKTSSNFKCSFTIHYSHEAYQWYQSTNSELFGYVCASRNVVHVYTGLCVALTLCVYALSWGVTLCSVMLKCYSTSIILMYTKCVLLTLRS